MSNLLRGFSLALDLTQGLKRGPRPPDGIHGDEDRRGVQTDRRRALGCLLHRVPEGQRLPAAIDVLLRTRGRQRHRRPREFKLNMNHFRSHAFRPPYVPRWKAAASKIDPLPFDLRTGLIEPIPGRRKCGVRWVGSIAAARLGLSEDVRDSLFSITERFDGNGFPRGLKGIEIPVASRIVAVGQLRTPIARCDRRKKPYERCGIDRADSRSGDLSTCNWACSVRGASLDGLDDRA